MRIVSRHINESILIGDDLVVTIRSIGDGTVTIGFGSARSSRIHAFDVPPDAQLHRDERLTIAPEVYLTPVHIRGDVVRLGFELPKDIGLHRKEVLDAIRRKRRRGDDDDDEDDDDFSGSGVPR